MALQTSGAISLNQIHVEAGGTSGTTASLNDSDIRGLNEASGKTINNTSGTTIDFDDFYGASNAVAMSTTNYARINSGNNSTYVTRSVTSGIVFLSVTMDMRLRRQDNFVYYEVKQTSGGSGTWYNTSGTGSTLSSSYVTLGKFNLGGITAIKMSWSETSTPSNSAGVIIGATTGPSATYVASNNTFQSVSNGQSIGARMTASASAECYQTQTAVCTVTMNVTAQKSGYLDTTLGTYRHQTRAVAISNNCF